MNPAGLLLLTAATALAVAAAMGSGRPRAWLGLTLTAAAAGLTAALTVLIGPADWEWRSTMAPGGEPLHLRLDGLSALFLALLSVAGGAGAAYSRGYWPDREHPESAPRSRAWWSGLVLSMGLVLVASNGLHFLVAWELFAVCAFFLITLDRGRKQTRAAGWLFLAASHAGTVCLFAFFASLAARTGSWDLGPMREQTALAPLFWVALAGFGVKAGVFPVHIWLPSAHANAPSHVSAILSSVAIKMGVYGVMRFSGWLPTPPEAGWVVLGLGAVSALLGIAFAIAQHDLKRLLAYCSVENVGIIFIGLGAGMLAESQGGAPWGRLALAGALLHVWNHGAFKSLLFFGAGSVVHATGTRDMSRLGGLWRAMPWTTGLFTLGAAAVAGLPPLNGFVSEWLIYLGLFDAAALRGSAGWGAMPAAVLLATAGALALAAFLKATGVVFLGAPRTAVAQRAHEAGPWMLGPMLSLAGVCVGIGVAPALFRPLVERALEAWRGSGPMGATTTPLGALGAAHLALAALAVTAGWCLWRRANTPGLRRAPTWDCGYARPAARMQYTSGAFGALVVGWFQWALRPVRRVRRLHGAFPQEAFRMETTPDTVLEEVVRPAAGLVMRLSAAARRLQHGRLQAYVLYLVAGLIGLGAMVLIAARQ